LRQERGRGETTATGIARRCFVDEYGAMPSIVVIIPCLNEAEQLPTTLKSLEKAREEFSEHSVEIIVVDGGSHDGSTAIAEEYSCRVIESDRQQRAHQLNLGVDATDSEVLWFVHADTRIPPSSLAILTSAMENPEILGGGFCRRFSPSSLYLRWSSLVADLRGRFFHYFYGDQAMFVRRSAFDALGGFDEGLDIAEDLDFSLRLREMGKIITLPGPVIGSARRFAQLGARTQIRQDRQFVKAWMKDRGWSNWRRSRKA